jgi:ABC-type branched-subunit amino acid transport system substrate-binding protein
MFTATRLWQHKYFRVQRLRTLQLIATFTLTGCARVLDLDGYSVDEQGQGQATSTQAVGMQCSTTRDCASTADAPAVCVRTTHSCVPLKSEDCTTITGDYTDDEAIVIGSLYAFGGAQAGTSSARQNAAILAVHEINGAGGIPQGDSSAAARQLVLLSCDTSANLVRAGKHLVDELHVPAIVGPNSSQDTIDLSRQVSVPGGTVLITPTALASSIADLTDNGLTWQMVPTDLQRGPFLTMQLQDLAAELIDKRKLSAIKFAAVFRDDALGIGTRTSLNTLVLNNSPLATLVTRGDARVDAYNLGAADQQPTVRAYAEFAPDIIVLAGTSELVQDIMVPLERAWHAGKPRPYYMLIDSLKNKELLDAVGMDDDLRKRVRGTGILPSPRSKAVYDAFQLSYQLAYPGMPSEVGGLGPSYDATYAIAFALAATFDQPISGRSITKGLRMLMDGRDEIEVQAVSLLAAFSHLVMKDPITAIGTFGPLAWGPNGAVLGGTLELWCVESRGGRLSYQSSGITLDLASGDLVGYYVQCE